jgi:hypothetical protein
MKNRYALLIVVSSVLGITFVLTNTIFIEEGSNRLLNGIALFKFFTLQSNLIVMTYFSLYVFSKLKSNRVFNKLFGGVVIYISITFLVFLIFLEPLYSPKGFALAGSLLNHYITPLFVLDFLYEFRDDYSFNLINIKVWIIYPIIYLVFLFTYGLITNDFIYPFFQVSEVGVIGIIASVIGMVILFIVMSFSLVKIVSKK